MKIPLSPLDYYFLMKKKYTIEVVLSYKGVIDELCFESAIRRVEEINPIFNYGLHFGKENSVSLVQDSYKIPLSLRQIKASLDLSNPDVVTSLLDSVVNDEGAPLIKIKLTEENKHTHIGFSFSHLLGDGFSFFKFLSNISSAFNGEDIERIDGLERQKLSKDLCQTLPVSEERFFEETGYVYPSAIESTQSLDESFVLTYDEIENLKKESIEPLETITTNDLVMAFLFKKYYKSIPSGPSGSLILRCPVDYRKKFPEISDNYFGNAVRDAVACFTEDEAEGFPLVKIAERVRQSINSIDVLSIEKSLQCLNDMRVEKGQGVFESVGCPGLLVSNVSKLPFDKINFGLGQPIDVTQASMNSRFATVMSSDSNGLKIKFRRPL